MGMRPMQERVYQVCGEQVTQELMRHAQLKLRSVCEGSDFVEASSP
jgi:hypothetical protein